MYEENNPLSWTKTLTALFTFFIVIFTAWTVRNQLKNMKYSKPKVTKIKYLEKNKFRMFVVNNKSPRVSMHNILYAKKTHVFYDKFSEAIWDYPEKFHHEETTRTSAKKITRIVTFIEDQLEIDFSIPNFAHKANYKIRVKTSGGNCQYLLKPVQDLIEN